jgi:hypothetical protein
MYVESQAEGLVGPARIGRVSFSKTGKTLYYKGKSFQSLKGSGFKTNYFEVKSRDQYWISGPRRDGADRLHVSNIPVEIDEDVKDEYFARIRTRTDQKSRRGWRFQ